ncbi:MAG TPA: hypothetical protein VN739_06605 [Nitrososphaerales archaeon]|nr:hypothetical protein [Nitrososphaerales archaeon]
MIVYFLAFALFIFRIGPPLEIEYYYLGGVTGLGRRITGFRKLGGTELESAGMSHGDAEIILGHLVQ